MGLVVEQDEPFELRAGCSYIQESRIKLKGIYMTRPNQQIWTNIAVGVLGLFVGISNLLRGSGESANTQDFIIGIVCTILATGWLVAVLLSKKGGAEADTEMGGTDSD